MVQYVHRLKERFIEAGIHRYNYEDAISAIINDLGNLLESNGHSRTDKNYAPAWIYQYAIAIEALIEGKTAYGIYHDIFCIMLSSELE